MFGYPCPVYKDTQDIINERKSFLNASQFRFRAYHSTTLQYKELRDHVNLNLNNKLPTAAVFLDIEKYLILKARLTISFKRRSFETMVTRTGRNSFKCPLLLRQFFSEA
jgi:hypothetical protein